MKNFILNNKGKIFLFILTLLTIFLYVKGNQSSADYNSRLQNQTSVISTVTNIEEKTRTEETTISIADETETISEEVPYFAIETTYEYNNKKYTHQFYVDSLNIQDDKGKHIGESYHIGKTHTLMIDSEDPGYVFDEDPGNALKIISYILAGLLLVIFIYIIGHKLFPDKVTEFFFVYPWLIAAIISFIFGIRLITSNSSGFVGYLLTFLLTPIYIGLWLLFSKISKKK